MKSVNGAGVSESERRNPYRIDGPAMISFSGGRTSGFMLRQILDAHGGTLPADMVVCFANTGLEHEATLEFVREVEKRWCPVVWLEFRPEPPLFAVVGFETASRNGEPFKALNQKRKWLPNPVARTCTANLKVRVFRDYCRSLGWEHWDNVIGLRYDEPRRVANANADNKERWTVSTPIATAKHTLVDVLRYWALADFDLRLPDDWNGWGNCKGCFLKARHKIERIAHEAPQELEWWAEEEEKAGQTFRADRPSYRGMLTQIRIQGRLFEPSSPTEDSLPCMCTE